jgi:large subunit ribosomal protein L18
MKKKWIEIGARERRHLSIRKKVIGTQDRPRLSIYRSLNHLYAQLVDDSTGKTLAAVSTASVSLKDVIKNNAGNVKGAVILGEALAKECKTKGITKVVFDRSGYLYHGRVKALAEAARKGGLAF